MFRGDFISRQTKPVEISHEWVLTPFVYRAPLKRYKLRGEFMIELLPVDRRARATGAHWGRLFM